ncbi:MAG TPA: hypothetical protein VF396_08760 [Bradyrhizobium sp.]
MLKYVSKIAMDILPSVAATIIGAYIVNHYIVARPASDAPAAAAVSSVNPKKVTAKADSKPAEISHLPEAGVRAKGISEKAISEKAASEKAASEKAASEKVASEKVASEKAASEKASLEKPAAEKPTEKSADRPAETASIPADPRRHQAGPREKTAAKTVPAPAVVPAAVATPDVATPNTAPPVEAAIAPEDRVNANEIARVTLERLRGTNEGPTHTMEASRTPDPPRLVSNPPAAAPAVRPLPPPIMVSTPGNDSFDAAPGSSRNPPYAAAAPADDPRRPTPPADIPTAPPLDLRAEAVEPPPAHTNVAEDMLSSVKSVFHAVLPKPSPD